LNKREFEIFAFAKKEERQSKKEKKPNFYKGILLVENGSLS